jgi:hypothetical protein
MHELRRDSPVCTREQWGTQIADMQTFLDTYEPEVNQLSKKRYSLFYLIVLFQLCFVFLFMIDFFDIPTYNIYSWYFARWRY